MLPIGETRVTQDAVCARKALAEHEKVRPSFANVTWCHVVRLATSATVKSPLLRFCADVGHDRSQPCGHAASPAAPRGADGCGDEIMHVGDGEPLYCESVGNRARIGGEQGQRLRARRNQTQRRVVDPANQRCHGLARHRADKRTAPDA